MREDGSVNQLLFLLVMGIQQAQELAPCVAKKRGQEI
jgi:hypothetical protein